MIIWISIDPKRMKALESKISKHKRFLIMFFFPIMFSLLGMATIIGVTSDNLINNSDSTLKSDAQVLVQEP